MKAKIVTSDDGRYVGVRITCPGCGQKVITTDWTPEGYERYSPEARILWKFNGDLDKPTFSPSLLWKSGHYCSTPPVPGDCWCDFEKRMPEYAGRKHPECSICHSFVRDGKIEFLNDCTHALAGQTVELPEIES